MTRFPIRYSRAKGFILSLVGAPASSAFVEVGDGRVRVRMSWAFRATFDRARIESVNRAKRVPLSAGAHGWRGHWLVNGAASPIVAVRLDRSVRAWVAGFPVRLRELSVSIADPDAFIAELS